jgi:hypothetical protein
MIRVCIAAGLRATVYFAEPEIDVPAATDSVTELRAAAGSTYNHGLFAVREPSTNRIAPVGDGDGRHSVDPGEYGGRVGEDFGCRWASRTRRFHLG